ncbi:hypothetical protein lerEdw1_020666 [Lerista edwardsae]|nr:hypothetical protein lerEdw1_020666 [Lerista edwardsae]
MLFLGYQPGSKAWRFGTPGNLSVTISHSATFAENAGWERLTHGVQVVPVEQSQPKQQAQSVVKREQCQVDIDDLGGVTDGSRDTDPKEEEIEHSLADGETLLQEEAAPSEGDMRVPKQPEVVQPQMEAEESDQDQPQVEAEPRDLEQPQEEAGPSSAEPPVRRSKRENLGKPPRRGDKDTCVLIVVFVDDLALMSRNSALLDTVIEELKTEFQLRELGGIRTYLWVDIEKQPSGGYNFSQKNKIVQLVKGYSMEQCKGVSTPMILEFQKGEDADSPRYDKEMYQSLVGSLLYLSQWTRPDIAAAVNILTRFISEPKLRHWQAAKRILRYLKETVNLCLSIQPKGVFSLKAYTDADWAADIGTRQSTSGFGFVDAHLFVYISRSSFDDK